MKGLIMSFRRGMHRQNMNQMIILPDGSDSAEKAKKYVGKTVVWKSPKQKELVGKVSGVHGGKGAVRAIFPIGLPGQSLTEYVEFRD